MNKIYTVFSFIERRRLKAFTIALLILGGLTSIFFACNKENVESLSNTQPSIEQFVIENVNHLSAIHKAGSNAEGKIISYDDMTASNALLILEATSNFDFQSDNIEFQNVTLLDDTITCSNSSEGVVSGSAMLTAYNSIYTFINEPVSNGEIFIVSDMDIISANSTTTTFSLELMIADPISIEGGRINISCDFGATDYWYPIGNDGKCGPYEGDYEGLLDAMDKLEQKTVCDVPFPGCGPDETIYIYNIQSVDGAPIWNFEDGEPIGYFEFYPSDCFDPDDMGDIRARILEDIDYYKPSGKFFKGIQMHTQDFGGALHIYLATLKYANYTCNHNNGG